MKRRSFLKLIGVVVLAPSLPALGKSLPKPEWGWFRYRGYRFRKDIRMMPFGEVIQLYTRIEINGEWYHNAILIDKEDYSKYKDECLDSMVHAIERKKRRLAG